MATNLIEFLTGKQPEGFVPHPMYSRDGDTLTFFFRNEEAYAERVDELLTIYKTFDSGELAGCKIKGVRSLLKRIRSFGVSLRPEGENVQLGLLFLSAASAGPPQMVREYYQELGKFALDVQVNHREFEPCT